MGHRYNFYAINYFLIRNLHQLTDEVWISECQMQSNPVKIFDIVAFFKNVKESSFMKRFFAYSLFTSSKASR